MRCPRIGLVHSSIRRGTEPSRNFTRWALYHGALGLQDQVGMVNGQCTGALTAEREADASRGRTGGMELVVAPVEEPAADALATANRELAAVEGDLESVFGRFAEGVDAQKSIALDVGERDDRVSSVGVAQFPQVAQHGRGVGASCLGVGEESDAMRPVQPLDAGPRCDEGLDHLELAE